MQIMRSLKSNKSYTIAIILIAILVLVTALLRPVHIFPDSEGYITAAIYRTPVYPLFLKILNLLFGSYEDIALIASQTLMGISAALFMITKLRKWTSLSVYWLVLLFGMVLYPYIAERGIGNNILSEAISYPLYLITITFFFNAFLNNVSKPLTKAFIVLFVLLLTRTQFVFLVPIGILICLNLYYRNRTSKKPLILALAFLILPFLTNLADKTYHYVQHNHFVSTPWTGIHLFTPAIFTAEEGDNLLYEDPQEKDYFETMFAILKEEGLNVNHKKNPNEPDIDIYEEHYSKIANATLFYKGLEVVSDGELTDENFILVDQLTTSMTATLTWDNKVDWTKLYIMNFINGFGSISMFVLFVILFLISLTDFIKEPAILNKTVLFFTICTMANMAVVSIAMHTIQRFTFYNDWVLFLIVFLTIDMITTKKNLTNEN
ncbi:hypothetical protein DCS32_01285 [Dokdonia sp. Dokd-P16]|uniref:hypothetical protein n=1 Tax=Dokdonia sp. Dokd-P16 TaxID=2173169 RepID=UPI000D5464C5|nr:hypothetical protein [Dokdonia sp. Dokd-P16]AWH72838.1 hypothetical protein DCS32_01285 [Dokdonia sp. Dokd-P16]